MKFLVEFLKFAAILRLYFHLLLSQAADGNFYQILLKWDNTNPLPAFSRFRAVWTLAVYAATTKFCVRENEIYYVIICNFVSVIQELLIYMVLEWLFVKCSKLILSVNN